MELRHTEELTMINIQEIATQQEIDDHLYLLNIARVACEQSDRGFDFAAKNLNRDEIRNAYYRKNATQDHYMRISEWLLTHTPHGFFFDEAEQVFKLR